MNAETFNSLYRIGTPVFAYPGCRPEDIPSARRLVTRTRTVAQVSASGTDVVWVEGEGSYISLTHVDPVSESVWRAAKQAEETAAAVAAQGALPVPVGDQPQPLDDTRLAEITTLLAAATPQPWLANERIGVVTNQAGEPLAVFGGGDQDHADAAFTAAAPTIVAELLAAVAYHRHWEQIGWRKANAYHGNWVRDDLRLTRERQLVGRLRQELSRQGKAAKAEAERLKARVAELEAERHTTNEALTDAAEALRANRDRIAEPEAQQPTLCGRTRDISGTEYPPCELRAGHWQAYCRSNRGRAYFLAIASNQPATPAEEAAS
ncbi:hypothetical protein [Streptomyces iakyrus]|uniref:hypothetical protein n=1 Tax=Streptomyces iakyrus TaxID=68219 RepID=UPI0036A4395F